MLENKQDLQFDITHNYKVLRGKKKGYVLLLRCISFATFPSTFSLF